LRTVPFPVIGRVICSAASGSRALIPPGRRPYRSAEGRGRNDYITLPRKEPRAKESTHNALELLTLSHVTSLMVFLMVFLLGHYLID
jgi:hypothetical protein